MEIQSSDSDGFPLKSYLSIDNASSTSSPGSAWEHEQTPPVVKPILLVIFIVIVTFSNACSIVAIVTRGQKLTRMYFFILHLSVADILTAFTSLLPELVWTYASPSEFNGSDGLCKLLKFVQMVAPYLR